MNCEKNAVVCEGYHEKQIWKSGRERAEEGMIKLLTHIPLYLTLPRTSKAGKPTKYHHAAAISWS